VRWRAPTDAEQAAVRDAVREAESASGAEIVPVLAPSSDDYPEAAWAGAAWGALAGALASLGLPLGWPGEVPWEFVAAVGVGALVGGLAARLPAVRSALVGGARYERRASAAAWREFVRREVFRTRDRTGILIYVSAAERRVVVLADEGVYAAVPAEVWRRMADEVASAMRGRPPAEALLDAVRQAGALVAEFGPRRRPDDANELPDEPVTSA